MGQNTFPSAGRAHCAKPILRARPTGNTGNTKNTGVSTRKRVSHVPWNFRSTWITVCYRQSIVFPVFIVFIVGFAPTMRSAQCAPPTTPPRGHALQKYKNTWHSVCPVPPCPFCPFCPSCPFSLPAVSAPRKALCQPNRVGGCPLFGQPSSHTTVRAVRHTAVQ